MDWNEFIFSDDFREYRRRQVDAIVKHIHGIITDDPIQEHELRGALKMAQRLIRLPMELINNDVRANELNELLKTDSIDITATLVQEYIKF